MKRIFRLILIAVVLATLSTVSFSAVFVSVAIAPPVLPVYAQPVCPGVGYIWVPGYWAYGQFGYYWVPGTWVFAPFEGALWTPGYWGWGNGAYLWHEGFWGLTVGFYGGINYGFGYTGVGYAGGYWNHGAFYYNRAVNNVDPGIVHNVYNKTVVNNFGANRVSFNGGRGGTTARPTAAEVTAARARRTGPTSTQASVRRVASTNHAQLASVNHGRPSVLATRTPAEFTAHGAAPARGATANRAGRVTASTNRPVRGTSPAARSRQVAHAGANRSPANHVAARQQRAPVARSTPRANTQASRVPRAPARYSARNNPTQRPVQRSTGEVRSVPARPVAPRNNTSARHTAPQASHDSAHNNTPARQTAPSPRSSAHPAPHAVAPSHYTAHAHPATRPADPTPRAVQPRESAPRPSAPAHDTAPPRRDGGRS
jgi:hypothetical protein